MGFEAFGHAVFKTVQTSCVEDVLGSRGGIWFPIIYLCVTFRRICTFCHFPSRFKYLGGVRLIFVKGCTEMLDGLKGGVNMFGMPGAVHLAKSDGQESLG